MYTLSFETNGGSTISLIQVADGQSPTMPSNPTRSGYVFAGWYTDDNTFLNAFTSSTAVTSNVTVYAKWVAVSPTTYTVTFEENGGSTVSDVSNVTSGATIVLPTDSMRSGYTFGGWFTDDNTFLNAFTSSTAVTSNVTVYAKWVAVSPTTYTVTFNTHGGSAVSPMTVSAGGTIVIPTTSKSAVNFVGWFETENYLTQFTTGAAVNMDMTLHAAWTPPASTTPATTYVITFDGQSGSTPSPITVTSGATAVLPNSTGGPGTFAGWYTQPSGAGEMLDNSKPIYTDLTVYAKWN